MSDTVKLIINIPKDYYEIIKHDVDNHLTDYRPFEIIANGTPLDDLKAEIADLPTDMFEVYKLKSRVLYMLDNIGKESEEV